MKKIGAWIVLSLLAVGTGLWWMLRQPAPENEESHIASTDPLWPLAESHAPAFQQEPLRETEVVTEPEPEETVLSEPPEETPPSVKMGEEHWAGGVLKAHGPLKQRADGQWVKDGVWTNYWANGRINTFGQYEADEPVGTWPFWMDQGQALLPNQYRPPTLAQQPAPVPAPPAVAAASGDGRVESAAADAGAGSAVIVAASNDHRPSAPTPPPTVSQPSVRPPAKPPVADGPVVFTSSGCIATRWQSLDRNAAQVVATLRALFPEVLFEMDQRMGMLKATGCDRQLALLNPFFEAAVANESLLWQALSEERLWNAGAQMGLFHHSVYGFDLKRPTGNWKTQSVVGDASWGARLGGKVLWGLTLSQKTARIMAVVLDVERPVTASELGEKDLRSPLGLWPQAAPERNWKHALSGPVVGAVGGVRAQEKTTYRSRVLWKVGAGNQKVVCDRWYLAQPSVSGSSTRLYFFLLLLPEADFLSVGRTMDTFVAGFSMPETPMQPMVTPDGSLAQALAKAQASGKPFGVLGSAQPGAASSTASSHPAARAPYVWRIAQNTTTDVQAALKVSETDDAARSQALWQRTLPMLSGAQRIEALWKVACAQIQQRHYAEGCATLERLEKEGGNEPLVFEAALMRGNVEGFYQHHWNLAAATWQRALKLAREPRQKWQAACKVATVPFYKRQYRPALESLEGLLREYPTDETADFVRWYIWYLKNCVEKKI